MKKASRRSFMAYLQIVRVVLTLMPQTVFAMPAAAPSAVLSQGDAALSEALTLIGTGQWQAALAKLTVAQQFYHNIGDPKNESTAWRYIGLAKFSSGDNLGAVEAYKASLALAQRVGDGEQTANVEVGLGRVYLATNQNDLALQNFQAALDIAQKFNNVDLLGQSQQGIARVYLAQKQYDQALKTYQAA